MLEQPADEEREIYDIFDQYSIPHEDVKPIVEHLKLDREKWVNVSLQYLRQNGQWKY